MLEPAAIYQFADRQKRLLKDTYDEAWQRGVDGYQPDSDPPDPPPPSTRDSALAGLSGPSLLATRRLYPYQPPATPDPALRAAAMAPAYGGLNHMVAELSMLAQGHSDLLAQTQGDFGRALELWAQDNASRLDGGDSVAWAGEQVGFGQAALWDGVLLEWVAESDERVCDSCLLLSSFPPMALPDWPTVPGGGATDCRVGCRCSLEAVMDVLPGDTYLPDLSGSQSDLVGVLADRQAAALDAMMGDASYLD